MGAIWAVNLFHAVQSIERKASKWLHVVRGEINKNSSNVQARVFMARSMVDHVEEFSAKGKNGIGSSTNRSSTLLVRSQEQMTFSWRIWKLEKPEKTQIKLEVIVDFAMPCKLRKIPGSASSLAANNPDEAKSDEHQQREILRTTNTRETETVCACICE